jgi:hypothetical protein
MVAGVGNISRVEIQAAYGVIVACRDAQQALSLNRSINNNKENDKKYKLLHGKYISMLNKASKI